MLTIDFHYRCFLGNTQNGFYLSGFLRYASLERYLGNNNLFYFGEEEEFNTKETEHKIGIGVGIGYRIFSYKGFYWGTSISFGRYIIGDSDNFYGNFLSWEEDLKQISDVELLKFGYAF